VLKAIEQWASQSEGRVQLLVTLVCIVIGLIVVGMVVAAAIYVLPPGYWSAS
jgi:hypothetical protein